MSLGARLASSSVLALVLVLAPAAGAQNVALGAPVAPSGAFGTNPGGWCCSALAPYASVTDGVFLAASTQWNVGTVWWNTNDAPDAALTIDLGGRYSIFELVLQADDNDTYLVEYRDEVDGPWLPAWAVDAVGGVGMQTRTITLGAPIAASGFRISAGAAGDEFRSVSEFQAITATSVVPEPSTVLLLGSGLVGLALVARRRRA